MKKILTTIFSLLALVSIAAAAGGPSSLEVAKVIKQDARTIDTTGLKQMCPGGVQEIDLAIADFAGGSMTPVTTAIELGLFEKNCVKVNLVKTTGDQSKLLMTGRIDAISEPIELLHLDMVGNGYADAIIVRVISDRSTIALVAKSDDGTGWGRSADLTDRLHDLQGKRVAVNVCDRIGVMRELDPNSTGTQQLRYLLESVGLHGVCGTPDLATIPGVDEKNVVYLIPQGLNNQDVVKVALSGAVDAAIVPSPYHVTKGLRVIVNHIEFPEVPGSALMVMREWYQQAQNRDTVARMHVALVESTEFLMHYPNLAKVLIMKHAHDYAQMDLNLQQATTIYEGQKSFWSKTGTASRDEMGQIQYIFMSDLGLVVGLCGCPGTEDSFAFGAVGGNDPVGERDGYILYTTPFHSGNFEGLIVHESAEWNKAFQITLNQFGITDPHTLNKSGRGDFYIELEGNLFDVIHGKAGGDSEGY